VLDKNKEEEQKEIIPFTDLSVEDEAINLSVA